MDENGGEIDWRQIIERLKAGEAVEVPVESDQDRDKLQQRFLRRAERRGMQLEFGGGSGVLQVRRVGDVTPTAREPIGDAERQERRERRERRRQAES